MRLVRRMCVGFSAGVFRRFVLKLNSFPHRLWVLADDACSEEDRQAAVGTFYALPLCCIGFFGRQLRRLFPDAASLSGKGGRATIKIWLRTQVFSIYNCEKEHASCRRLLLGTGPARSWTLCARERLLECSRTIHMQRSSWDPASDIRPAIKTTPATTEAGEAQAGSPSAPAAFAATPENPLQADPRRSADSVGVPLQDVHAASDLSMALALPTTRATTSTSGVVDRLGGAGVGAPEALLSTLVMCRSILGGSS